LDALERAVHTADPELIRFHLKEIVPEYNPPSVTPKFRPVSKQSAALDETRTH
jgi:hypothetical protein